MNTLLDIYAHVICVKVSSWSPWRCVTSCGNKFASRHRSLVSVQNLGGKACPALRNMADGASKGCHQPACPVDCKVTGWGDWGACSTSCGPGVSKKGTNLILRPSERSVSLRLNSGGVQSAFRAITVASRAPHCRNTTHARCKSALSLVRCPHGCARLARRHVAVACGNAREA